MATKVQGKYYDVYDVMDVVWKLSHGQGYYGRLYEKLLDLEGFDPEGFEDFKELIAEQKMKDPVDVVLFFEC